MFQLPISSVLPTVMPWWAWLFLKMNRSIWTLQTSLTFPQPHIHWKHVRNNALLVMKCEQSIAGPEDSLLIFFIYCHCHTHYLRTFHSYMKKTIYFFCRIRRDALRVAPVYVWKCGGECQWISVWNVFASCSDKRTIFLGVLSHLLVILRNAGWRL